QRQTLGISDQLIRVAVGIEAAQDLWDDFEQALVASAPQS
ncbi:MAG: PLP-dependent transferase, partial [Candidatus Latescibacterota bacterium]|nr:PLP-dependent transferase [Candidatus Latescibacterota bacterium]